MTMPHQGQETLVLNLEGGVVIIIDTLCQHGLTIIQQVLNLNSLLVKRQIDNPSPEQVDLRRL